MCKICGKKEDIQKRLNYFNQHGYDCLVIWEHELNENTILRRINSV